jgi:hypothetical protein
VYYNFNHLKKTVLLLEILITVNLKLLKVLGILWWEKRGLEVFPLSWIVQAPPASFLPHGSHVQLLHSIHSICELYIEIRECTLSRKKEKLLKLS